MEYGAVCILWCDVLAGCLVAALLALDAAAGRLPTRRTNPYSALRDYLCTVIEGKEKDLDAFLEYLRVSRPLNETIQIWNSTDDAQGRP